MEQAKITLSPEQKTVVALPPNNPIQIKGVAGSGKTTVALFRAQHLMDTQSTLFRNSEVAIFTFNKLLVQYIKSILPDVATTVVVTNFHKWAFNFLRINKIPLVISKDNRGTPNGIITIFGWKQTKIIANIVQRYRNKISAKGADFYIEEFSWMKGKVIRTKDEYLNTKRSGRGTNDRITQSDKVVIWEMYRDYNLYLKTNYLVDYDDYALMCLDILTKTMQQKKPFTHIVIDEAQDLSKAEIIVISQLVSKDTQSITLIADAAQKIFKSGFTWSEVGLNIRGGRTVELKKSYRCTGPVASAAASLLENESDKSEFTTMEIGRLGGLKPIIGVFKNEIEEYDYLIKQIFNLRTSNSLAGTVVLHRTNTGLKNLQNYLVSKGIQAKELREGLNLNFNSQNVMLCTMSSIKGLEFENVIIVDLNDDIIPMPSGFNSTNDEYHISTERRILYTAMTRARERLYLLASGKPSRYLSEIGNQHVKRIEISEGIDVEIKEQASNTAKQLSIIVQNYPDVMNDGQRLRGILKDFFPGDDRICDMLLVAYYKGIYHEMKKVEHANTQKLMQFAKTLQDSSGINEELSIEAIYSWAYTLKLI
jgi:superfamily I DNA/RNA helicase